MELMLESKCNKNTIESFNDVRSLQNITPSTIIVTIIKKCDASTEIIIQMYYKMFFFFFYLKSPIYVKRIYV